MAVAEVKKLNILFSEKAGLLVVSFIGSIVRENRAEFEEAFKRLSGFKPKWTVLHFREVPPNVDKGMLPELTRFEKVVRDFPSTLRISSLHPELRKYLLSQGVVRTDELVNNLQEAIESFGISIVSQRK